MGKKLRGTVHSDVYVSRDLTYAQRTELYRRRQARQVQPGPGAGRADGVGPDHLSRHLWQWEPLLPKLIMQLVAPRLLMLLPTLFPLLLARETEFCA